MKRSILLAISLLLLAPSLDASKQCINSVRCPQDKKTPNCCEPPPCEYFFALMVAKAQRHAASLKVQRSALAVAKADDARGQAKYEADFNRDFENAARRFANCPPSHKYSPAPILAALPEQQCRITVYEGTAEVDLNKLKADNSDACGELLDAERAGEPASLVPDPVRLDEDHPGDRCGMEDHLRTVPLSSTPRPMGRHMSSSST